MPLTPKGQEILSKMEQRYGEKKGKSVFYASQNAGTIKGVDAEPASTALEAPSTLDSVMKACDDYDKAHGCG